jgi:DegV family protein with EDD domain
MRKVAILTDSTAYLPAANLQAEEIHTVPLNVIWGEETYEDGITITPDVFYHKLKTAQKMPTTSQVAVGLMKQKFEQLLANDYDVLGIFISASLSGTVQSALQAKELVEKDKDRIEIVDSRSTTMAMGFQALATARAAKQGLSLAECKQFAEQTRERTGIYFVVDTLEFLHRGGRISGTQRFLGTALNMKPILYINNGKLEALERVRTKDKALNRLVELVAEQCAAGKGKIQLAALHADSSADAKAVLEKATQRIGAEETLMTELSPVIGTHVGPGAVALAYMTAM